jgi:hypothetical protein
VIIAIDFDGTCVKHQYPQIGPTLPMAVETLRELAAYGHELILYTMRSGKELQEAVDWWRGHGLPLYGINQNPVQSKWTESPKAYAHLYIDDAALGCPVKLDVHGRDYVDWPVVRQMLRDRKVLP